MNSKAGEWRPWIVLVAGFLGAGKTSLIIAASKILKNRGLRCAVVLNDQGEELVDTRLVQSREIAADEITGGCFCCRFSDLLSAFERLHAYAPDVIFAEPVGSCTDLVATVLRPLREDFELGRMAPFTVLVDPARLAALLSGDVDADVAFLMRKQMEEADLVCLTKSDLYPDAAEIPAVNSLKISARTGVGVREWLDQILTGCQETGSNVLEIDYQRYARAEAALAWLNLSVRLETAAPLSPALIVGPLLDQLDEAIRSAGVSVAHLKLLDRSASGWVKAAICANGGVPDLEGDLDAEPAHQHELALNLRAIASPAQLREIVERRIRSLPGSIHEWNMSCFSPAPPVAERRTV